MDIKEKKIFLVLSPHINYYHSYRGDSKGVTGFGKDVRIFNQIFEELDKIEERGFPFGYMPISWDYGDIFWSIQLQKEFQNDTLERLIERCKQGKDEVLIGSWGNCAQPVLDTEELIQDHNWFLENSMGIGVNQLFPGRVAPYARTQETMFTQGMIELYNKLGIEGICLYYSMYGFDVGRPFINPRLNWNQRYGIVELKSTISNASCLMIPMYGFGDRLDFCSTKKWFEFIRKKQVKGEIKGHALIFFNFDMDSDNWIRIKLPKFLQWLPNSSGLMEFAETVDNYEYVEFATLLDIVPQLPVQGATYLREDVADGMWNGFYNWAQKYNNTRFWTQGQRARWMKCASDTIISRSNQQDVINKVSGFLRNVDDSVDTYLKNKILFASTTNFGMAMPFLHPDRFKTAMNYSIKAFFSAKKALDIALNEYLKNFESYNDFKYFLTINPINIRGISEKEVLSINSPILVRTSIPKELLEESNHLKLRKLKSGEIFKNFMLYHDFNNGSYIEAILFPEEIENKIIFAIDTTSKSIPLEKKDLEGSQSILKNQFLSIKFNSEGKINSFQFNNEEIACPSFLESSVSFGNLGKERQYNSIKDNIVVLRDGSDGFSASVKIIGEFEIIKNAKVQTEKILTVYSDLPYVLITVVVEFPDIKGESSTADGATYYVDTQYDDRWQEVMPCEIRPQILREEGPLRVWKRNFFGVVDYFDLDMKEVDPKNADIDCLVSNISDGWMTISNQAKGLAIGFNSLKSANFAFSPLKVRDKGFKDLKEKAQQVRINPFGTYYGEIFNYWSDGNGHAQKMTAGLIGTNYSTAPTFSGKKVSFELVLAPYHGDKPPKEVQSFLDHFSLEPLICIGKKNGVMIQNNYEEFNEDIKMSIKKNDLEKVLDSSYLEWVRYVNENFSQSDEQKRSSEVSKLSKLTLIRFLIDGMRGR